VSYGARSESDAATAGPMLELLDVLEQPQVVGEERVMRLPVPFHKGVLDEQLTATIHGTPADLEEHASLISILETKAGRLIVNGFPTGVEVSPAMQHGGPYPATTDSRSTSVGTAAINRFTRPVAYQGFPQPLLAPELRDDNPRGIWRLVDGELTKDGW